MFGGFVGVIFAEYKKLADKLKECGHDLYDENSEECQKCDVKETCRELKMIRDFRRSREPEIDLMQVEGSDILWKLKQKVEEVDNLWLDGFEFVAQFDDEIANEIEDRWEDFLESLEKIGLMLD